MDNSLLGAPAWAADARLEATLAAVEARYNRAKTLQVLFQEEYTPPGAAPPRSESGRSCCANPAACAGITPSPKASCSSPTASRSGCTPPPITAPRDEAPGERGHARAARLLLGKLHFQKEFRNFKGTPRRRRRRASPPNPKPTTCPIPQWSSWSPAENRIREVKVTAFDKSILDFTFDQEKMDPPLDAKLFQFQRRRARSGGGRPVSHGGISPQIRRWARPDPPAGGRRRLRKGTARPVHPAGLPDLFHQAAGGAAAWRPGLGRRKKLNLEKFLIFNQQFVTLIRAGLPILKALDLLADRLTDPKLGPLHQGGARRGAQRHAALGSLPRSRAFFPRST